MADDHVESSKPRLTILERVQIARKKAADERDAKEAAKSLYTPLSKSTSPLHLINDAAPFSNHVSTPLLESPTTTRGRVKRARLLDELAVEIDESSNYDLQRLIIRLIMKCPGAKELAEDFFENKSSNDEGDEDEDEDEDEDDDEEKVKDQEVRAGGEENSGQEGGSEHVITSDTILKSPSGSPQQLPIISREGSNEPEHTVLQRQAPENALSNQHDEDVSRDQTTESSNDPNQIQLPDRFLEARDAIHIALTSPAPGNFPYDILDGLQKITKKLEGHVTAIDNNAEADLEIPTEPHQPRDLRPSSEFEPLVLDDGHGGLMSAPLNEPAAAITEETNSSLQGNEVDEEDDNIESEQISSMHYSCDTCRNACALPEGYLMDAANPLPIICLHCTSLAAYRKATGRSSLRSRKSITSAPASVTSARIDSPSISSALEENNASENNNNDLAARSHSLALANPNKGTSPVATIEDSQPEAEPQHQDVDEDTIVVEAPLRYTRKVPESITHKRGRSPPLAWNSGSPAEIMSSPMPPLKRKRGRPFKNYYNELETFPKPAITTPSSQEKGKRGRPIGSRNRSKCGSESERLSTPTRAASSPGRGKRGRPIGSKNRPKLDFWQTEKSQHEPHPHYSAYNGTTRDEGLDYMEGRFHESETSMRQSSSNNHGQVDVEVAPLSGGIQGCRLSSPDDNDIDDNDDDDDDYDDNNSESDQPSTVGKPLRNGLGPLRAEASFKDLILKNLKERSSSSFAQNRFNTASSETLNTMHSPQGSLTSCPTTNTTNTLADKPQGLNSVLASTATSSSQQQSRSWSYTHHGLDLTPNLAETANATATAAGQLLSSTTIQETRSCTVFTQEDDDILRQWVTKAALAGKRTDSKSLFKELSRRYCHHFPNSWRDRWLNVLLPRQQAGPQGMTINTQFGPLQQEPTNATPTTISASTTPHPILPNRTPVLIPWSEKEIAHYDEQRAQGKAIEIIAAEWPIGEGFSFRSLSAIQSRAKNYRNRLIITEYEKRKTDEPSFVRSFGPGAPTPPPILPPQKRQKRPSLSTSISSHSASSSSAPIGAPPSNFARSSSLAQSIRPPPATTPTTVLASTRIIPVGATGPTSTIYSPSDHRSQFFARSFHHGTPPPPLPILPPHKRTALSKPGL